MTQAAYPPPRDSCVRGADRAAVDKRLRFSWSVDGIARAWCEDGARALHPRSSLGSCRQSAGGGPHVFTRFRRPPGAG
jgi:hypothetical protein